MFECVPVRIDVLLAKVAPLTVNVARQEFCNTNVSEFVQREPGNQDLSELKEGAIGIDDDVGCCCFWLWVVWSVHEADRSGCSRCHTRHHAAERADPVRTGSALTMCLLF